MSIVFDLTVEQNADRTGPDEVLGFAELTSAARDPRALARLLWGENNSELILHEDSVPKSAKQAGAALIAAFARAETRRIRDAVGTREVGGLAMLAHGAAELSRAAPREIRETVDLRRRSLHDCGIERRLPRRTSTPDPASAIYVRGNPTMRWKGQLVGGAATHMTGVVNGLLDSGLDVEVLAAAALPEIRTGVTEVPMRRIFHFEPWLTMAAYAAELERASEGLRADLIYQRYEPGSLAGLRIAATRGVPLVLEYNGSELWVDRNWSSSGKASRGYEIQERIEQRVLEQASLAVVVSEPLRAQLLERGIPDDRILVNPNGVDVEALEVYRTGTPASWRAEAGLREAPTIGFIGTFGLWHGVLELPEMVEAVSRSNPEARWVLVGDGEYWPQVRAGLVERGLEDRVAMPGALPRERALAMLAASEICVSPHVPNPDGSRFFGSPTKLFEYMGLAKPVVASDLEQIGEVLDDGETALLHEPGDSAGAATALSLLLEDPDRRERIGRAALAEAEARYTWRAHARRILDSVRGEVAAER